MGTKHTEMVGSCDEWQRQHFHIIHNDSAPNSPDVEECSLKSLCNCCGKPITGKEFWNKNKHDTDAWLCEACQYAGTNKFADCKHDGSYETYMASFGRVA